MVAELLHVTYGIIIAAVQRLILLFWSCLITGGDRPPLQSQNCATHMGKKSNNHNYHTSNLNISIIQNSNNTINNNNKNNIIIMCSQHSYYFCKHARRMSFPREVTRFSYSSRNFVSLVAIRSIPSKSLSPVSRSQTDVGDK